VILIAGNGPLPKAILQRLHGMGADAERLPSGLADDESPSLENLQRASVLVLAADNDSINVDLALRARQLCPDLPLIVRIFDSTLGAYLSQTISGVTVLSMSRVSAPVFAEAARKILAEPSPSRPAKPAPHRATTRNHSPDRTLVVALVCLFLLVFPSALVFSHALGIRYMDALYFVWTTVMTVGYGDIALKDAGDGIKLFGMVLMLAGASFIAVLFALLSDRILTRRLEVLNGRVRVRGDGHVIVAGAGNVGYRLAEMLASDDRRLVVIEHQAEGHHVAALRAAGHQVIIADATTRETLALAGIERAALVLALTDFDAANLQIALHAREAGTPVVMRVESPELSAHVTRRGDGIAFSPIDAAAEAFALAATKA